jgi:hypothetical protein
MLAQQMAPITAPGQGGQGEEGMKLFSGSEQKK